MDLNNSGSSGMQNPIFDTMYKEENNFNNNNEFDMIPPVMFPPFLPFKNNLKKKYSNEAIDNMMLSLKDFNNNIQQMMETTNRMFNIINKYNENNIHINFAYKNEKNFSIKCKLDDKLSDVISKINTGEENFNINDKLIIINGRALDINKTIKEEGILNGNVLLIIDK